MRSYLAAGLLALFCEFGCGSSPATSTETPNDLAGDDLTGVDLSGTTPTDGGPIVLGITNDVQIIVEPGDDGAALVAAINAATTSVHMTMYQLTAQTAIDALIARKNAGKEVKVLLNQTFPAGAGSNASVFATLQTAGVQVQYAPATYVYTHEKSVLIDSMTAWIMTLNVSESGFSGNREYIAVDTDAADVAEAEALFQKDWANQPTATTGKLITAPDNAEPRLVALVDQAKTSVDIEGEVFSADSILQAVGRAQKRGCTVRLVLSDEDPTSAQTTALMGLKQVNIPVHVLSNPFVHAKLLIADGKLAYVGSENFTANSLESNRELGLIVGKQSEVDKLSTTFSADFAAGVAQ